MEESGEIIKAIHYLSSHNKPELLLLQLFEEVYISEPFFRSKDQQHMMFLLYWLNKFIFPNRSSAVLLEYRHLAEALHNHTDIGLGPTVLAHLFKNLHIATLENPLNLHDTKRLAAQWQVVIRKTYPWFQPGYRLFEKEPEEEATRIDFRKKFLSVTLPRDLPHGGGSLPIIIWGSAEFDAWWKAKFQGLPASSTGLKILFDGWDSWVVHAGEQTHRFMVQTIKDINAQAIEGRFLILPVLYSFFDEKRWWPICPGWRGDCHFCYLSWSLGASLWR
ncbi:unnamed protein product [Prunus armeniaca]